MGPDNMFEDNFYSGTLQSADVISQFAVPSYLSDSLVDEDPTIIDNFYSK